MDLLKKAIPAVLLTFAGAACQAPPAAELEITPVPLTARDEPAPRLDPPEPREDSPGGADTAAKAAERFSAWAAVHPLLSSPIAGGAVVDEDEAITFTRDNLVAVTRDAGASWTFIRHDGGTVRAVSGAAGGPYAAVGAAGYIAISTDGKTWTSLPRQVDDDLVSVAVGSSAIVATTRRGDVFVAYGRDGAPGMVGTFPDRIKASQVVAEGDAFVALAGRTPYTSLDGTVWAPLPNPPPPAKRARAFTTSQGQCALGRIGKIRGVVCEVKGDAFGVDATTIVVARRDLFFTSRDGGKTWAASEAPFARVKAVTSSGGRLLALGPRKTDIAVSSDGGGSWQQLIAEEASMLEPLLAELEVDRVKCDETLPAVGETCKLARRVTSPAFVPNAKGLTFKGETGLAYGDYGLVMSSRDGGASWAARSGFAVRGLTEFAVGHGVFVAMGKTDIVISTDAGKSFQRYALPKGAGRVSDIHISPAAQFFYAVGTGGTVLRAVGADPSYWQLLDVGGVSRGGRKVTASFVGFHEVGKTPEAGGILFAAGKRGELFRSIDRGDTWTRIATGTKEPIQVMAAEGDVVVAVTNTTRRGGNLLLKSDDGGRHFTIAREISHQGPVDVLSLTDGVLTYRDRRSTDFGATWTRAPDARYWSGAVKTFDGALRLASHRSRYVRDAIYLLGADEDDWVMLDGVATRQARFLCGKESGCWMIHDGEVYRPL